MTTFWRDDLSDGFLAIPQKTIWLREGYSEKGSFFTIPDSNYRVPFSVPSFARVTIPNTQPKLTVTRSINSFAIPIIAQIACGFAAPQNDLHFSIDLILNSQLVYTTPLDYEELTVYEKTLGGEFWVQGTIYQNLQNPIPLSPSANLQIGAHGLFPAGAKGDVLAGRIYVNSLFVSPQLTLAPESGEGGFFYVDNNLS